MRWPRSSSATSLAFARRSQCQGHNLALTVLYVPYSLALTVSYVPQSLALTVLYVPLLLASRPGNQRQLTRAMFFLTINFRALP